MWPIFGGFNLEENTATLLISVDVHFPKMDVEIAHPPPAVRIKALRANHIPRFQTHSVRVSAGRQKATPLDVSAGRQTGRNYPLPNPTRSQEIGPASLYIRTENPARRQDLERFKKLFFRSVFPIYAGLE